MPTIEDVCAKIRAQFDELDAAREHALTVSRRIIRDSADTIRAIHRGEMEPALAMLAQANQEVRELLTAVQAHLQLANAGFVQDAQKEHAEAQITYALARGDSLPDPDSLGVGYAPYLNGMAEATGELRRHILDSIRLGHLDRSEALLTSMDDIYYALITFDYPDAISQGLKHRTDSVRASVERTRADLTNALRQRALETRLLEVEQSLEGRK